MAAMVTPRFTVNNYCSNSEEEKLASHNARMNREPPQGFDSLEHLSKAITHILRHAAPRFKIKVHAGGYVKMNSLLQHFRDRCTQEDIERVVDQDRKQRFHIKTDPATGEAWIRANQGHTFEIEDDGTLLEELLPEANLTEITHGTTSSAWMSIKKQGLSRMRRNHIHFIPGRADVNNEMLPGFRTSSRVLIIVNIRQAILDGIKFYRSKNGVILSPGDEKGFIDPKYFQEVIDASTNEKLLTSVIRNDVDSSLFRIIGPENPLSVVYFGTSKNSWETCKRKGLSQKKSGWFEFRKTPFNADSPSTSSNVPTVMIAIDVRKARNAKVDFYESPDGTVYSKGDDQEIVPAKCFKKAVDLRNNDVLFPRKSEKKTAQ